MSIKIAESLAPLMADKDITGKPVYSFEEGRKLGIVKDVFFDNGFEAIAGLSLGREGLFARNIQFASLQCLKLVGEDVILVESADNLETRDKQSLEELVPLSGIIKREVVDRGIKLALVGDVAISPDAKINQFPESILN